MSQNEHITICLSHVLGYMSVVNFNVVSVEVIGQQQREEGLECVGGASCCMDPGAHHGLAGSRNVCKSKDNSK